MVFRFYSDLSKDGPPRDWPRGKPYVPRTHIVGGFFSSQSVCNVVEDQWDEINRFFHVPRFHASHLNAKSYEYDGWDDIEQKCYSKKLLKVVNDQGKKLRPLTCGMLADEYSSIINDKGRKNLGSPYLACFKACIALIAMEMTENFPAEDKFEVFLDRDDESLEAVACFSKMQDEPSFPYRHKLASCTRCKMEDCIPLQVADMVAYEVFRRLHVLKNTEAKMRPVLESLYANNAVSERYFGAKSLRREKTRIESAKCLPGGLIFCPAT